MRIAYITPYQGPTLIKRRPIVKNLSMSNATKIELIAQLLRSISHEVEILSHGEVVEHGFRFYPAFEEAERFNANISVYYISALPIRRVNGLWSSMRMLRLLRTRHRISPFGLVIIFNLKAPQVACAKYVTRRLRIPVILEYEDDGFVDNVGKCPDGFLPRFWRTQYGKVLKMVSGCIGVSPHLLAQVPPDKPKMLLRGVIGDDVPKTAKTATRMKRVLFSGTHIESNGVAQLIEAWRLLNLPDWELHITGAGQMSDSLRKMARITHGTVFHGLVSRDELVRLMCSASICVSPQAVSDVPGNVFPFKVIEYLAAGSHVVATPMGVLEPDIEAGITYLKDNSPETIAAVLGEVIRLRRFEQGAQQAVQRRYGSAEVADALKGLIAELV